MSLRFGTSTTSQSFSGRRWDFLMPQGVRFFVRPHTRSP